MLLGPIAVARIDSFTIPIAVIGMLLLATAPKVAGMLLTIAAWIKVWPAALIAAAVVALGPGSPSSPARWSPPG